MSTKESTKIKEKRGIIWHIIMYDPNQCDIEEDKREVIINKKYKNLRDAYKDIGEKIKDNKEIRMSYETLRKLANGSYITKDSILWKVFKINKGIENYTVKVTRTRKVIKLKRDEISKNIIFNENYEKNGKKYNIEI